MKYFFLVTICFFAMVTKSDNAVAQSKPENPFGLVYSGAITENKSGEVTLHSVSYVLNGIKISANIYTPANFDSTKQYPVIVVAHPNGGVKEQVAGLYAQRLAEQGFITIAADAAFQGASGGLPRNVDKPANRMEDIRGMADFISQFKGADINRLGLLGVCGGGGYALAVAQTDKRFKAVATLSMFNSGVVRRDGYQGSQIATLPQRLKEAADARAKEAAGGEVQYIGGTTLTDDQVAKLPFELYRQGYEYYVKSHAHPNSTSKYTMSSIIDLVAFDAIANMRLIDQPLLLIAGSKADSYYMTDAAYKAAVGTTNKELYLIANATHIETYWVPKYVDEALNKLKAFFSSTIH